MRVSVRVGETRVDLRGGEWSMRDVRSLVRLLASVQETIGVSGEESSAAPIGFSAVLERAPVVEEDLSEWFEEERSR